MGARVSEHNKFVIVNTSSNFYRNYSANDSRNITTSVIRQDGNISLLKFFENVAYIYWCGRSPESAHYASLSELYA